MVCQVGFWSGGLTTLCIVAFNLTVVVGVSGFRVPPAMVVGSALLIAPSFVILMASLHTYVSPNKKLWSQIGLSFTTLYAAIVGLNYFLQLTMVQQNPQGYAWLSMDFRSDSASWALETLGYTCMSLAALFAVPVLAGGRVETTIRWLFIMNGAMTLIADIAYLVTVNPLHLLVLVSLAIWSLAFPIPTLLLAMLFKRAERMAI